MCPNPSDHNNISDSIFLHHEWKKEQQRPAVEDFQCILHNGYITKLNPDLQVVVRLIQSLEAKMDENTKKTCEKIEEKAREVETLKTEVSSLKSQVCDLNKLVNAQQYELDNLKHPSNKEFLILSGPGIANTESQPANIVSATLANKINHRISPDSITEASKIKIRANDGSTKHLLKFKIPYQERTE